MPLFRSCIALLLCAALAPAAELKTLSGKVLSGELVSINDKDGVVIQTKEGNVATPLVNILQLDLSPVTTAKLPPCSRVELTDGTQIYIKPDDGFRLLPKNQVELTLLSGTKMITSFASLHSLLRDAHDPKVRESKDWQIALERSKKKPALDVRAVRNAEGVVNAFRVTFLDGSEGTKLKYVREGREAEDTANPRLQDANDKAIFALIFAKPPSANNVPSICKLDDLDQNRLSVAKIEMKEGGPVVVTAVTGAKAEYPLKQIARLDFSKGKIEYISDLPKDGVDVTVKVPKKPDPERTFQIGYNKNWDDKELGLRIVREGKEVAEKFAHGLFLPATSELVYGLGGEYDEFTALIGVDEASQSDSHVRVTIEADGVVIFSADVTPLAVTIKGQEEKPNKQRTERIALSVKDVKDLRIKVEPADGVLGTFGGHVDLADAKISKASK